MSKVRKFALAGGTVACALGIGFVMQNSDSAPQVAMLQTMPLEIPVQQSVLAPSVAGFPDANSAIERRDLSLTVALPDRAAPVPLPMPLVQQASLTQVDEAVPVLPRDPELPRSGCDVTATAIPDVGAMARLSVSAPCFSNERVTVHHSGMMFTDVTDAQGSLDVDIPVLSADAVFIVSFSNGMGAVAETKVPHFEGHDRVVLQWADHSGFQIHAREFGAGYGDDGHVWTGADHDLTALVGGTGGFMTRLGDGDTLAPRLVEVYTFPTEMAAREGTISLSVEAEVTAQNCGREISAQAIELTAGGVLRTRDLVLAMPGCDAAGDFLVLNNLVDDLKIAAN